MVLEDSIGRLSCARLRLGTHQTLSSSSQRPLTACLHQEQLMATISLLWKVNFCWKPCVDKVAQ